LLRMRSLLLGVVEGARERRERPVHRWKCSKRGALWIGVARARAREPSDGGAIRRRDGHELEPDAGEGSVDRDGLELAHPNDFGGAHVHFALIDGEAQRNFVADAIAM